MAVQSSVSGWGRYPQIEANLERPEKLATVASLAQTPEKIIARGKGRSYGDAALNSRILLTERLNRMLAFNPETGVLRCEAGVTFQEILEIFIPRGWFPSVTPGTKFITVGGAVACDVHGKNHHREGGFSSFVRSFSLVLANGDRICCSRTENPELFWATIGGMGLTGIITEVEFSLHPIETAYIQCRTLKAANLEAALSLFEQSDAQYQYSVAWIDCLARGNALGRSVLMLGNHATVSQLSPLQQANPLYLPPKPRRRVPLTPPAGLLNRYTMQAFNSFYYHLKREGECIQDYDTFFYPLDFVEDWNKLYGKPGFIQYQCVFPLETSRQGLTRILELCSKQGWGSFLAVLKRLGSQEGWLSFPMAGYTLALDMAVKPGLWEFLDQLDKVVLEYGGRVYLAKDARLSAEALRLMYPQLPQWLAVKSQVDPHNQFSSVLSQRLQLHL
ncbi:FAD-binding oxidoreductase [Geitlerinema splendidum]|nr:FAD-binding oxidoreductase [Geitlerinema splendidum]